MKNSFGITNDDLDVMFDINNFTQIDIDRLRKLKPAMEHILPVLTEKFYIQLQKNKRTAVFLEGCLESLKLTHLQWMQDLFTREFDSEYVAFLWNAGKIHAELNISPLFVASSMSFLRSEIPRVISNEMSAKLNEERCDLIASVLKILDINQFIIDSSYDDHLLAVTGMSKKLLHKLMS